MIQPNNEEHLNLDRFRSRPSRDSISLMHLKFQRNTWGLCNAPARDYALLRYVFYVITDSVLLVHFAKRRLLLGTRVLIHDGNTSPSINCLFGGSRRQSSTFLLSLARSSCSYYVCLAKKKEGYLNTSNLT